VNATFKAWSYVFDHRSEAIEIMMKKFPELDRTKITSELDLLVPLILTDDTTKNGLGYSSAERWDDSVTILYEQKLISDKIEASRIFTNDFIQTTSP
jgi:NitT/TauT family transport system substrate-binding protein